MFDHLLQKEVQQYIKDFKQELSRLAFSGSPFTDVSTKELLQQIQGRQKAKTKLPTWFKTPGIIYPAKLHLEQTSSEATAIYKQTLVKGNTLADITGGFGIDSYYFAQTFAQVHHFEIQEHLCDIVSHNLQHLPNNSFISQSKDGLEAIKDNTFDVIYVDPSRRHDSKGKVFFLEDCEPNIPKNLEYLLQRCTTLLVKTSPMLDISVAIKALENVAQIHIVALHNEVKEVLWILRREHTKPPEIHTANITKAGMQKFTFTWNTPAQLSLSAPLTYLYEPNASILKSGAFNHMCGAYRVLKLHKHSHLYTSQDLVDFPGRRFKIEKIVSYSKKQMRSGIDFDKANISTRNFPETVAKLQEKWKLQQGGNRYLFFTTIENDKKIVLICSKIIDEV